MYVHVICFTAVISRFSGIMCVFLPYYYYYYYLTTAV